MDAFAELLEGLPRRQRGFDQLDLVLMGRHEVEKLGRDLVELIKLVIARVEDFIPRIVFDANRSASRLDRQRRESQRRDRPFCNQRGRVAMDPAQTRNDDGGELARRIHEELVMTAVVHFTVQRHHGQN
jgi:hypothetical protein